MATTGHDSTPDIDEDLKSQILADPDKVWQYIP